MIRMGYVNSTIAASDEWWEEHIQVHNQNIFFFILFEWHIVT